MFAVWSFAYLSNTEEPFKKCLYLLDHTLLFFGTVSTTKAGHRRHELIDCRYRLFLSNRHEKPHQ